jgi:hypothetical protein
VQAGIAAAIQRFLTRLASWIKDGSEMRILITEDDDAAARFRGQGLKAEPECKLKQGGELILALRICRFGIEGHTGNVPIHSSRITPTGNSPQLTPLKR